MKIVVIGAGNVATHLAKALHHSGFEILQVYSRTIEHASLLAGQVNAEATDLLAQLDKSADIYLVSVKDNAVAHIASQLRLENKIIAHTSGVLEKEVLKDVSRQYGVFYPLQTFTRNKAVDWVEIPFCIEGSNEHTTNVLKELAGSLSSRVHEMSSKERAILHVAAVFTNNFVNHLLLQAKNIAESAGIPFDILKPLALETINKAFETGPDLAQTGPAIRGDINTIEKHKALLKDSPQALELYELLTRLIQTTNT